VAFFLILERSAVPPFNRWRDEKPALSSRPDPQAPPIRPEHHGPNSITTMRKRLTIMAKSVYRCPCCQTVSRRRNFKPHL
jgi:hypothetical protein